MNLIEFGDCRETMKRWAAQGIKAQTCVTSPPYFGLRDYGHEGQIGLEETPEEYIAAMAALQHSRKYIGCELNKNYEQLQKERIASAFHSEDTKTIDMFAQL